MKTMKQPGQALNGLTSEFLAPSAYRVWGACMDVETPWESAEQEAWDRVATMGIRIIDEKIEMEMAVSAFAFGRSLFVLAYGPESIEKWPAASIREQKAWETVGRHIINCLDADPGSVDPERIEPLSVKWFVKQLGDLQ